jgi:uncharacterized protein YbjT (DUF2867 family)
MSTDVFVTGGSGYLGRNLIPALRRRGHRVRALVRPGSEGRVPAGCEIVRGNVLDRGTFMGDVTSRDTVVHLVGTPRPSPAKAREFRDVDLASAREAIAAAANARVRHFVYVSVAHPAPVMRAYIAARFEAERLIEESGVPATILRPWYVLGPGHWWPSVLKPAYWVLERIPSTRESALRLGLVTIDDMTRALVAAVERTPEHIRIVSVPDIRSVG